MNSFLRQLDPSIIKDWPAANVFLNLCEVTGTLAEELKNGGSLDELLKRIRNASSSLTSSPDHGLTWKGAVARECLLAASLRLDLKEVFSEKLPETLLKVSPFGEGGPALRQLLMTDIRYAVAIFPLADESSSGTPGLGQAWAFSPARTMPEPIGADAIKREGATAMLHSTGMDEIAAFLCVEEQDRGFTGDSWQLASALAARTLAKGNSKETSTLARRWCVSGKVEGERVERVQLGNKLELVTDRRWLLPSGNRADLPPRLTRQGIEVKVVPKLEDAWRHVAEKGTTSGGSVPWPQPVDCFHTFTSKAYSPAIAAVLFSRPREEIVLWDSGAGESREVCDNLKTLLPHLYTECPAIKILPVSSKNVAEAESALRMELEKLSPEQTVLFNITNGNLLMRMAAGNLGPLFPFIRFIYRDVDNADQDYTCVQYDGLQPETTILQPTVEAAERTWIKRLFFTPRIMPVKPWHELLGELLGSKGTTSKPRSVAPPVELQPPDSCSISRALQTAISAHDGQLRKGTLLPYISHPLHVALILAGHDYPAEVIAAGLLHDTVEDTDLTLEQIAAEFGNTIAELVAACGEPDKTLLWKERKEHTISTIACLPESALAIIAADKLHNVRSMVADYKATGDSLWLRFNHGREEQSWYYTSIARELVKRAGTHQPLARQLEQEVSAFFAQFSAAEPPSTSGTSEKSGKPVATPLSST